MGNSTTCCCCIPIRAGIWILAALGLIGAVWYIVQGLIFLTSGISTNDIQDKWSNIETQASAHTLLAIGTAHAGVKVVFGVIHLILTVVLIHSLSTYNARVLRIWVKAKIVLLILGVIATIALLTSAIVVFGIEPGIAGGIGAIVFLVLVIEGYYICVVNEYAKIIE